MGYLSRKKVTGSTAEWIGRLSVRLIGRMSALLRSGARLHGQEPPSGARAGKPRG